MNLWPFRIEHRKLMPGVPIFLDEAMTLVTQKPSIDIIELDEWAQLHDGYVEDGKTSLADHIQSKYGDEAVAFLQKYF